MAQQFIPKTLDLLSLIDKAAAPPPQMIENEPVVCTDLVLNSLHPPTTTAPPPPPQVLNSLYHPSPINEPTVCTDLVLNSLYPSTTTAPPPPPPPQVSTITTGLNSSLYPPPITTNHLSLVRGPFNNVRRFTPKTLDLLSLIDKAAALPPPPPVVSSEEENTKQPENEPASAPTVCTDLVFEFTISSAYQSYVLGARPIYYC